MNLIYTFFIFFTASFAAEYVKTWLIDNWSPETLLISPMVIVLTCVVWLGILTAKETEVEATHNYWIDYFSASAAILTTSVVRYFSVPGITQGVGPGFLLLFTILLLIILSIAFPLSLQIWQGFWYAQDEHSDED